MCLRNEMGKRPVKSKQMQKRELSRGGLGDPIQALGWASLPVLQIVRLQAKIGGCSQQGPAGPSPQLNSHHQWANGLHSEVLAHGTRVMAQVVGCLPCTRLT